MKIAIDARWIFREISGIGNYTRELIRHLARIDRRNEYILFFADRALRDRTIREAGLTGAANFRTYLLAYGLFSLRNQLFLPAKLDVLGIDVFHSPNYMIPLLAFRPGRPHRTACVVTIHDVIPMIFPAHAPRSRKARLYPVYRRLMHEVGARADTIVTDSDASRADVIRHLAIPPERADRVVTVHCGVGERYLRPPPDASALHARAGAATRHLLFVGRMDPYKNLTVLVRALAEVRRAVPFPVTLTIAGAPDPRYPDAQRAAAERGVASAIHWSGYLSDDDLLAAYRRADVLVHPSRYEGFGLQVVEAMALGLPVVCSRGGSLPEVAGDAALLVDADDAAGFADAIRRVLTDEPLARALAEKGRARAAGFTWQRTAERTLQVYEQAATRLPRSNIQHPTSEIV